MKKETQNLFCIVSFFAFLVTLILSFMNNNFISACMLMLSLFVFSICFRLDDNKKTFMYILFGIGVLLIIGSLVYIGMRVR